MNTTTTREWLDALRGAIPTPTTNRLKAQGAGYGNQDCGDVDAAVSSLNETPVGIVELTVHDGGKSRSTGRTRSFYGPEEEIWAAAQDWADAESCPIDGPVDFRVTLVPAPYGQGGGR